MASRSQTRTANQIRSIRADAASRHKSTDNTSATNSAITHSLPKPVALGMESSKFIDRNVLEPPPTNISMSNGREGQMSGSSSGGSSFRESDSYQQSPLQSPSVTGNSVRRKLVVIGDGGSGKTSLLVSYKSNTFVTDYVPTVFENSNASVVLDSRKTVDLLLWDTAGQEDYDRLRPLSYPDSHVILICFAIDQRSSLENVEAKWKHELDMYIPTVPRILVGCKSDLRKLKDRRTSPLVPYEKALQVSKNIGAVSYIECSAKTHENVTNVFIQAARTSLTVQKKAKKKGGKYGTLDSLSSPLIVNNHKRSGSSRRCIVQ